MLLLGEYGNHSDEKSEDEDNGEEDEMEESTEAEQHFIIGGK